MRRLTKEEIKAHTERIKFIRARATRAKSRHESADITRKKLSRITEEVSAEESEYLRGSGIILYFGNYFGPQS